MTKLEILLEHYPDSELLKADGFDDAILGVADIKNGEQVLVYSITKSVEILITRDKMNKEDAEEYFYFNVEGAYMGKKTPIWVDDWAFYE